MALAACALLAACGGSAPAAVPTPTTGAREIPAGAVSSALLTQWPEFGIDPQRSDVSPLSTGITRADIGRLRRITVHLPGTIDSSAIYLHDVSAGGSIRDVVIATSTYGRTFAIDAGSGALLWTFTPAGYSGWAGSSQITTATPVADPAGGWVYAASPDGRIHKLAISDGREASGGSWPVLITRDATHEKITAALNVDGPDVIATTGGYIGDTPPYQGHLVLISRATGSVERLFNTLCARRRYLQVPRTCPSIDSAILSRGGAVVEPGGGRILVDTGNGPWNGTTDFGDSVIELSFPSLSLRQAFTPADQAQLNSSDTDLGSSAPALLGDGRVLVGGKDGILRVLSLSRLDGHAPGGPHLLGGELQRLSVPGGAQLFTAPAVWHSGRRTTVFVADGSGTAAYVLRAGLLYRAWQNSTPGTSPVMAGGLLYVYDPAAGGIRVYAPGSPVPVAGLPGYPGHWNSPIVVDGHVVEPEGDGNEHSQSGTLDLFGLG